MIEISKIKIDNNDLLIKDATARNNIASLSTNITSLSTNIVSLSTDIKNYLPLVGGKLTGNLSLTANDDKTLSKNIYLYAGTGYGFIQARSSSTNYQSNLLVQGGGNLLIGSGKSCQSMWSNNIQSAANNAENLFLNSDTNAYINTNVQTTTAVKTWTFDNSGNAIFPGSLTLGSALTIADGGTGATSKTTAVRNFFRTNVSTSTTHVLAIHSSWEKAGYVSLQALRNQMGLGNTTNPLPVANGGTGGSGDASWNTYNATSASKIFNGKIYYRKLGIITIVSSDSLTLSKELTVSSGTTSEQILPITYAPTVTTDFLVTTTREAPGTVRIRPDGKFQFYKKRTVDTMLTTDNFYINCSFINT